MKEQIQFEIDLSTLAIKLVEAGDADPLFTLLNHVALQVQQRYARQLPARERFNVFNSRAKTHLDGNAIKLLECMCHAR